MHRSVRRGSGVEFGGYREYAPGDDLRWLDRRSLLRHGRLLVRQFETETDRALCLFVDASASMAFRSPQAPGAKLAFASVMAAALARVSLASGDPVSLTFMGGGGRNGPVERSSAHEQFERIVAALEAVQPAGDARVDPGMLERAIRSLARVTRRGAIVVVFSDLIDLPAEAARRIAETSARGRVLVVVQTLDPAELHFPFQGTVRLRELEGGIIVETDAETAREPYIAALTALTAGWQRGVVDRGGRFLRAASTEDPIGVVRKIVESVRLTANDGGRPSGQTRGG
jgi:uncharacterized protein (DUF58 family)